MYVDRGVGGRENNGVALKEKDSNEESPAGGGEAPIETPTPSHHLFALSHCPKF